LVQYTWSHIKIHNFVTTARTYCTAGCIVHPKRDIIQVYISRKNTYHSISNQSADRSIPIAHVTLHAFTNPTPIKPFSMPQILSYAAQLHVLHTLLLIMFNYSSVQAAYKLSIFQYLGQKNTVIDQDAQTGHYFLALSSLTWKQTQQCSETSRQFASNKTQQTKLAAHNQRYLYHSYSQHQC
jgi:hypothetical protein